MFLFAFTSCLFVNAQGYDLLDTIAVSESFILQDSAASEELQNLSLSYYNKNNTLDRNYSFELYNKQQRLRMWSNEVRVFGYAALLGVCLGGPFLFPDASSWILIPTELVIAGGIIVGATFWANSLKNKAAAIRESSISILNIHDKSSLYISHYTTEWNHNVGIGIGYRYKF